MPSAQRAQSGVWVVIGKGVHRVILDYQINALNFMFCPKDVYDDYDLLHVPVAIVTTYINVMF